MDKGKRWARAQGEVRAEEKEERVFPRGGDQVRPADRRGAHAVSGGEWGGDQQSEGKAAGSRRLLSEV